MDLVFWLIIISQVLRGASTGQREVRLKKSTGSDCQTLPLGAPWTSVSAIECYLTCVDQFPDSCHSVVYNPDTLACTPGSTAFGPIETLPSSIPGANSNDAIYYLKQPVPACNASLGFALYDVCGTSACLYLSISELNYADAVNACANMNSTLFIAETEARFSLIWYVSLNVLNQDTWLGLTDIAIEGHFVWENGNPLSTWQSGYVWTNSLGRISPDNAVGCEHCVETVHHLWPGVFGLNDLRCHVGNRFICELRNG
ncbi:hypothetical protein RRG08_064782 [Elysia crispata]|uniref:C-type lectin domain-containing protein n=1 Tax=Elysia crispata TaxID=231223 RepID=A0AAE0YTN3_9GAST|nr:hypothetical protein RRG08_064782 [Elysia crispata]